MRSWPPIESLQEVQLDVLGELKPSEMLYEFEGPCIFTSRTLQGTTVLAYLTEDLEEESFLRYIVATTSPETIESLKQGSISVREALDRGSLWLVDFDYMHRPVRAVCVDHDQLPVDAMPAHGTMLWPSLEPVLTVRLLGKELKAGHLPTAALTQAAEIASKAFKPVFEWAAGGLRQETGGRPAQWLRDLYALPAQRLAFGSLELAFTQSPLDIDLQSDLFDDTQQSTLQDIQQNGWSAIREGLAWAASQAPLPSSSGDDKKWLAILQSMRRLSPGVTGPVSAVELWGPAIGAWEQRMKLDRDSTKRIQTALTGLKMRHGAELRTFNGRVRELDLDKLTFTLRDTNHEEGDVQLVLDDEQLLATTLEALTNQELRVQVSARSEDKKLWLATEIEFVISSETGQKS